MKRTCLIGITIALCLAVCMPVLCLGINHNVMQAVTGSFTVLEPTPTSTPSSTPTVPPTPTPTNAPTVPPTITTPLNHLLQLLHQQRFLPLLLTQLFPAVAEAFNRQYWTAPLRLD